MQKAAARAERVEKLVEHLERKLGIFAESATSPSDLDVTQSYRTICQLEAEYVPQGLRFLHAKTANESGI